MFKKHIFIGGFNSEVNWERESHGKHNVWREADGQKEHWWTCFDDEKLRKIWQKQVGCDGTDMFRRDEDDALRKASEDMEEVSRTGD